MAGNSGSIAIHAMRDNSFRTQPFAGTTAGLQDAISFVGSTKGKIILGPGTLTLTSGVSITSDDISIEGAGQRATVINYTGSGTAITFATTGGVSRGHRLANLEVRAGANQTGGLVQFTGGDFWWSIENVSIYNPLSGYTLGTGLYLLNCQNGTVSNLWVRSDDVTKLWTKAVDIDINDSAQRGNIIFTGGSFSNFTTGTAIAASGPSNSVNSCAFYGSKWVNSPTVSRDGKTCIDINTQADETGFYNCHFEWTENGIDNDGADTMTVVGCKFTNIHNDADSAGTCIAVTGSEGSFIGPTRINSSYNCIAVDGASQGCVFVEGRWNTISGTQFSDTSTGSRGNRYIEGATSVATGNPVGLAVASAANITLPRGSFFTITGTTNITSITASQKGRQVTLQWTNAAPGDLIHGSNIVLAGAANFSPAQNDAITLICDGTNWLEASPR